MTRLFRSIVSVVLAALMLAPPLRASYDFPNSTDYILIGSAFTTGFTLPAEGSCMFWIKPNTDISTAYAVGYDGRVDGLNLHGVVFFFGETYAGWVNAGVEYRAHSSAGFPASGVWSLVEWTWSAMANTTNLYIGGVLRATATAPATPWDTATSDQFIGNDYSHGGGPNSRMAYFTCWNRVLTGPGVGTELTNLLTCAPSAAAPSGRIREYDLINDANTSVGTINGTVSNAMLIAGDAPPLVCSINSTRRGMLRGVLP